MSIANELSSDVAAALLLRQEDGSAIDSNKLIDVVVEVHSTLKHLTAESRRSNRRAKSLPDSQQSSSAASGN